MKTETAAVARGATLAAHEHSKHPSRPLAMVDEKTQKEAMQKALDSVVSPGELAVSQEAFTTAVLFVIWIMLKAKPAQRHLQSGGGKKRRWA